MYAIRSYYACEDADITLMAKDVLMSRLQKINLMDLMEKVEMPLIPVLRITSYNVCYTKLLRGILTRIRPRLFQKHFIKG